uniref:Methyltransf_21 domain-containing protein n=1 Tax=Caenorhabditis japonica TaxID=281687 RepID=A0A8R1EDB8_CAEJA
MTTSQKNQTSTIEDLAKDAGVTKVESLKIDIEGAEKTCLIPFLEKFTVCQIYLEVHGGAQEHVKLLQEIAHLDYRLFSYEVNGFGMTACEYSFIHETCIEKYGGRRIAYFLDYLN